MKSPFLSLNSPILDSLENLGALNGSAIYEVKPFRDWKDTKWQNKIFKMRICNAGEGLEILEELDKIKEKARAQAMKFQILSRAIYMIENSPPVSTTELERFNRENNLQYDQKDYLVFWLANIEQVVLDRLDAIYAALQQKQLRQLNGTYICDSCGSVFLDVPEGSKKILYAITEIVCAACLDKIEVDSYDFEDDILNIKVEKLKPIIPEETKKEHVCPLCRKDFDSFEEFNQHLQDCTEKTPV